MYKLTTYVYETVKKNGRPVQVCKYVTVAENLTWDEAKEQRKKDKNLQIVKQ